MNDVVSPANFGMVPEFVHCAAAIVPNPKTSLNSVVWPVLLHIWACDTAIASATTQGDLVSQQPYRICDRPSSIMPMRELRN
jgi:hypothetical protein